MVNLKSLFYKVAICPWVQLLVQLSKVCWPAEYPFWWMVESQVKEGHYYFHY